MTNREIVEQACASRPRISTDLLVQALDAKDHEREQAVAKARRETAEACARVYWEESTYKKVPAYDGIKAAILACGNPPSTVPEGYPFGKDKDGKQCRCWKHAESLGGYPVGCDHFWREAPPLTNVFLQATSKHCDQCGAPRREQP